MSYELISKMDLPLYAGGSDKYMIRFEFPKPWWKPRFLHDREVAKIIKEIQEEFGDEIQT